MTYAAHRKDFAGYVGHAPVSKAGPVAEKPGVLRRIYDAILESRQRSANQEIARYLAQSGGRLTNNLEREVMERLMSGNWRR